MSEQILCLHSPAKKKLFISELDPCASDAERSIVASLKCFNIIKRNTSNTQLRRVDEKNDCSEGAAVIIPPRIEPGLKWSESDEDQHLQTKMSLKISHCVWTYYACKLHCCILWVGQGLLCARLGPQKYAKVTHVCMSLHQTAAACWGLWR